MTLHIKISGEGPDLVLLHGWAMHGGVFAEIASALSIHYRVHRIDLPGHGRSTPMVRLNELDALAGALAPHVPTDAIVIGWSLGGLVSLKLAQQQMLRALVLVSTTPRFVVGENWPHGMAPKVFAQFFSHLQQNLNNTVEDFLRLQVRGDSDAAATFAALKASLLQHPADPATLQLGLELLRDADERGSLSNIHVPTLVMAGEYDRITHPRASEYLAGQIPQARYRLIKRAGHAAFISHREQFLSEVQNFLSSIGATQQVAVDG